MFPDTGQAAIVKRERISIFKGKPSSGGNSKHTTNKQPYTISFEKSLEKIKQGKGSEDEGGVDGELLFPRGGPGPSADKMISEQAASPGN